jgi:hypothetical protein
MINSRSQEGVLIPAFFWHNNIALTIILGVDNDPAFLVLARINGDLHLSMRVITNIEDPSIVCEPGISPAPVVTDTDWSDPVDHKEWLIHKIHIPYANDRLIRYP